MEGPNAHQTIPGESHVPGCFCEICNRERAKQHAFLKAKMDNLRDANDFLLRFLNADDDVICDQLFSFKKMAYDVLKREDKDQNKETEFNIWINKV